MHHLDEQGQTLSLESRQGARVQLAPCLPPGTGFLLEGSSAACPPGATLACSQLRSSSKAQLQREGGQFESGLCLCQQEGLGWGQATGLG